jgi:hypothetical protein
MGTYDIYAGVQLKVGPCIQIDYEIGDEVPINDGIYYSPYDGYIVVKDGVLIMQEEFITDKWGNEIMPENMLNNNPTKDILERYKNDPELTVFTDLDGEEFMEEIDV